MNIPLSRPDITALEKKAVMEVLDTPHLSLGPQLVRFEELFRNYIGTKHAVAVNSGTSGLHLCLRALGIGPRQRVVTTPFSFISSANVALIERAEPVFVDIDPATLNIDTNRLEDKLRRMRDTGSGAGALLPVHVFGRPCRMAEILDLSLRFEIPVVEDACEALGAEYLGEKTENVPGEAGCVPAAARSSGRNEDLRGGQKVGGMGDCGVFAFYPNKQITTGEGGMIVTNNESIARLCRSMRNQGNDSQNTWIKYLRLGYNYRLSDINCALGIAQLSRVDEILDKRRRAADRYNRILSGLEELITPQEGEQEKISWFVYVVRLSDRFGREDRDAVLDTLRGRGIGCSDYFAPIHLHPVYKEMGYKKGDFPVTESVGDRTIALPFFNNLTGDQIEYVCSCLKESIAAL